MKLSLSLVLKVERSRPPAEEEQERDVEMGSLVERADPYPLGFRPLPEGDE